MLGIGCSAEQNPAIKDVIPTSVTTSLKIETSLPASGSPDTTPASEPETTGSVSTSIVTQAPTLTTAAETGDDPTEASPETTVKPQSSQPQGPSTTWDSTTYEPANPAEAFVSLEPNA